MWHHHQARDNTATCTLTRMTWLLTQVALEFHSATGERFAKSRKLCLHSPHDYVCLFWNSLLWIFNRWKFYWFSEEPTLSASHCTVLYICILWHEAWEPKYSIARQRSGKHRLPLQRKRWWKSKRCHGMTHVSMATNINKGTDSRGNGYIRITEELEVREGFSQFSKEWSESLIVIVEKWQ